MKKTLRKVVSLLLMPLVLAACSGGGGGGGDTPQGTSGAPVATVSAATSVTQAGATLNGSVIPNGLATEVWFEWGTDPALATYASTTIQSIGSATTASAITKAVNGCAVGTAYYFRVCASNSKGTTKSALMSFTTGSPGSAPTATTIAPVSVSATPATLNGEGNPTGLATTLWFEWGTDSALATYSSTPTMQAGSGTTSVGTTSTLSGLSAGTTYYFRVAANNASGTSRGTIISFTAGAAPTCATLPANQISATGAKLNGNVTPNGLATTGWFEWGTNSSLSTYSSTPSQVVGSGTTVQLVTNGLSGLSSGTTYYYRIAASNASGTSKGNIASFTCNTPPPNYVGTYSGQAHSIAFNENTTLDIVITGYSETTLTGTFDDHYPPPGKTPINSGYIRGYTFYALVCDSASCANLYGNFSTNGLTLSGTYNNNLGDYGTFTLTKM